MSTQAICIILVWYIAYSFLFFIQKYFFDRRYHLRPDLGTVMSCRSAGRRATITGSRRVASRPAPGTTAWRHRWCTCTFCLTWPSSATPPPTRPPPPPSTTPSAPTAPSGASSKSTRTSPTEGKGGECHSFLACVWMAYRRILWWELLVASEVCSCSVCLYLG